MVKTFAAMLACLAPAMAAPVFIVIPNAQTSVAGNQSDSNSDTGSFHSQEVFGSGQFSSVPNDILITQLGFRAAPGTGPSSLSFSSITFSLSTTQYGPNTGFPQVLTTNFAANLGPDNTVVYSAPLNVSSPGCAGPSPCPFDIVVPLTTPFLFHKNQGRLLMDIVATQTGGAGSLDSVSYTFPPGGPIASINGAVGSPTGGFDASGVVVQIGFTTPEPASYAGLLCGLAVFGVLQRRRRLGE